MAQSGEGGGDGDSAHRSDSDAAKHVTTQIDWRFELSGAGLWQRLPFAVPALLYLLKNNLVFAGLKALDPTTFQLLNNIKIVITTLLWRVVFAKRLTDVKWAAVLLLMLGIVVSQYQCPAPPADDLSATVNPNVNLNDDADDDQVEESISTRFVTAGNPVHGYVVLLTSTTIASLAGVWNDLRGAMGICGWLMKGRHQERANESLALQNTWLYFWGVVFNALPAFVWSPLQHPFDGWTFSVVMVALIHTAAGLAVSALFKYASNIVVLFATAASLMVTATVSVLFFGYELKFLFVMGACVVIISMYLYRR